MKLHWKILIGMGLGILVGLAFQGFLEAPAWVGARVATDAPGVIVQEVAAKGPAAKGGISVGDRIVALTIHRGDEKREQRRPITSMETWENRIQELP
ncbi:MAG: PDZ domain-containing protein, partial [Planctomycetota bacterium]